MENKQIITYGNFDMFHIGHLNLLKTAKALGSKLIVAVSTDEFSLNYKNKKCIIPYKDRIEIVSAIKWVDLVIPEDSWEQKITDIDTYNIDIFTIGDDWTGKFDFLKDKCEVVYLPRTPDISTTMLKGITRAV
jgi:glycerol-3-phosphate cytidylyltransferase